MSKWADVFDRAEVLKREIKPSFGNRGDITAEAVLCAQLEYGIIDALPAWLDYEIDDE